MRSLLTNGYFWTGLAVLFVVGLLLFLLFNNLLLPTYTRHDVARTVPDLLNEPYEEAVRELENLDLLVERQPQPFNPNLPRDVIVDQDPLPNTTVKPGRRIFLTVNSGTTPKVLVPRVQGMSLREARNRLNASGLKVGDVQSDSIPSPYANTVTRQEPAPGDSLQEGATVRLWYSTGLGDQYVQVPDLTGLSATQAERQLLDRKLRAVVVHVRPPVEEGEDETAPAEDQIPIDSLRVLRQSREPGTRVREGFEIRLFVGEEDEAAADSTAQE